MTEDRGRNLALSLPRRWVNDILYFSRKVPTVAGERAIRVRDMVDLRRTTPNPPSWSAIMMKAYAIAARKIPELRRAYMPYPRPHLYEAPYSVASVVIHREFRGEPAALIAPLLHPEDRPLEEIDRKLESLRNDPIESHGAFRRLIRTSKWPMPIRRLIWSLGMNVSGYYRARNFGTFAVNSLAAMRGKMLQTCMPITAHLYYGIPDKSGQMLLQMAFDHRVFDAYTGVHTNSEIEAAINGVLLDEVHEIKLRRLDQTEPIADPLIPITSRYTQEVAA